MNKNKVNNKKSSNPTEFTEGEYGEWEQKQNVIL